MDGGVDKVDKLADGCVRVIEAWRRRRRQAESSSATGGDNAEVQLEGKVAESRSIAVDANHGHSSGSADSKAEVVPELGKDSKAEVARELDKVAAGIASLTPPSGLATQQRCSVPPTQVSASSLRSAAFRLAAPTKVEDDVDEEWRRAFESVEPAQHAEEPAVATASPRSESAVLPGGEVAFPTGIEAEAAVGGATPGLAVGQPFDLDDILAGNDTGKCGDGSVESLGMHIGDDYGACDIQAVGAALPHTIFQIEQILEIFFNLEVF